MAWLWLFLPTVILLGAGALWRATRVLADDAGRLRTEIQALGPLTERAHAIASAPPPRALGRKQADR